MSLHLKLTMSKSHPTKEADNKWSPILLPGDWLSDYVGDLSRAVRSGQRCVGEVHIWGGVDSVNNLFAILFQKTSHLLS